jgi:hypothetical protein
MRALVLALLLALAFPQTGAAPSSGFDHRHPLWSSVLAKHAKQDGFDYAGLKADRSELDQYLAELRRVTPGELAGWTREQRFAFWINVYNAFAVDLVTRSYPIASIQSLNTAFVKVWERDVIPLKALHPEGKDDELSLDDVEHKILRPVFQDARVHAALNCASQGCPPLRAEAYVAERLSVQLDEQARAWLADPARNRYDRTATRVIVSKIFEWFAKDFARDAGSVQAWIARYAPAQHAAWIGPARALKIEYLEYSWKLNDARR